MHNLKRGFLVSILSVIFIFIMLVGGKAQAAQWACYHGATCQTVEASNQTEANTACNTGGLYSTLEGGCPSSGGQNQAPAQGGCALNDKGQEICSLDNPLQGNKTSATDIISTVIKGALGIIGALTLLMFVWGGFEWLTSAGNAEKVKMGTQTMIWAVIGVVLVFSSYLLLSTFTQYLTGNSR